MVVRSVIKAVGHTDGAMFGFWPRLKGVKVCL